MITPTKQQGKRRRRALVFDDDACSRNGVAHLLPRRGYEVIQFENTTTCCDKRRDTCACAAGERCADVIVSDVKMPGMDGLDFVDWLSERGCAVKHRALISGYWTASGITRAKQRGCQVIKKPTGVWELDRWLEEFVEGDAEKGQLAEHFRTKS